MCRLLSQTRSELTVCRLPFLAGLGLARGFLAQFLASLSKDLFDAAAFVEQLLLQAQQFGLTCLPGGFVLDHTSLQSLLLFHQRGFTLRKLIGLFRKLLRSPGRLLFALLKLLKLRITMGVPPLTCVLPLLLLLSQTLCLLLERVPPLCQLLFARLQLA